VNGSAKHSHTGLDEVRNRIADAARAAGRPPQAVQLVAVSKTFHADDIVPVIEAGQTVFGENRVQEAKQKWPQIVERYPAVRLHLIGPLQTNKVRDAVRLFDCIETVDRPKLARALAAEIAATGKVPDLLIQVNTGAEDQKAGVLPGAADDFIGQCRDEYGLSIAGLMCIPPLDEEPSLHFALLRDIAERNSLAVLSMGMSADFEIAVAFGATHVRVGSAIFGSRGQPPA
jgi:hypothetical protein